MAGGVRVVVEGWKGAVDAVAVVFAEMRTYHYPNAQRTSATELTASAQVTRNIATVTARVFQTSR